MELQNRSWFQEPNPIHASDSADTIFEEIPSSHSPDNVILVEHFPSSQLSGSDMIIVDSSTDTLPKHSTFDSTISNSKVVYSDIVKIKRVESDSESASEEEMEEKASDEESDSSSHPPEVKPQQSY